MNNHPKKPLLDDDSIPPAVLPPPTLKRVLGEDTQQKTELPPPTTVTVTTTPTPPPTSSVQDIEKHNLEIIGRDIRPPSVSSITSEVKKNDEKKEEKKLEIKEEKKESKKDISKEALCQQLYEMIEALTVPDKAQVFWHKQVPIKLGGRRDNRRIYFRVKKNENAPTENELMETVVKNHLSMEKKNQKQDNSAEIVPDKTEKKNQEQDDYEIVPNKNVSQRVPTGIYSIISYIHQATVTNYEDALKAIKRYLPGMREKNQRCFEFFTGRSNNTTDFYNILKDIDVDTLNETTCAVLIKRFNDWKKQHMEEKPQESSRPPRPGIPP